MDEYEGQPHREQHDLADLPSKQLVHVRVMEWDSRDNSAEFPRTAMTAISQVHVKVMIWTEN